MGCRRMLGAWDRAAIMAGVNVGLSQTRIAHLIGRSPSVVCRATATSSTPPRSPKPFEREGVTLKPRSKVIMCWSRFGPRHHRGRCRWASVLAPQVFRQDAPHREDFTRSVGVGSSRSGVTPHRQQASSWG